jgi:hypothetical protein
MMRDAASTERKKGGAWGATSGSNIVAERASFWGDLLEQSQPFAGK